MFAVTKGQPVSIIATIATVERDPGIIGRKDKGVLTLADLNGKRIGVTLGTSGHFVLDTFLIRQKLSTDEVTLRDLQPQELADALLRGEVDAVATWEPYLGALRTQLGVNGMIFYSQGIYELPWNLAGTRHYVVNHPETLKKLLRALIRAEQFYKADPNAAHQIIAHVLFLAMQQVRQELAKNETAGEIVDAVAVLRYLTLEYTLRHEERVQTQWQLKHASLAKLMARNVDFGGVEDLAIMDRLRETHASLHSLFTDLLSSYQDRVIDTGKSPLLEELEARLTGQMMNRTQDMIADALVLANRSRQEVVRAQERAGVAIIAFGGVLVLVIGITLFLTVGSVTRPLAKLREGTAIVGAGNLDHRLGITTQDEIGDLSRAFDRMTEQLQATTLSRDELADGARPDIFRE